jgi:hypothetical protein
MIVMVAADLVSIGAGWAVVKLDGDAKLHLKFMSPSPHWNSPKRFLSVT